MSITAQQVVSSAQTDVMNQIGFNHPILLDYCNRISLDILRSTKWDFLESDVKTFLTRQGVTSYWIGTPGAAPAGSFDTGLNITDIKFIKHGSVYDRSNFKNLGSVTEAPVSAVLSYTDGSSRPGRPAVYRNNVDTPFILNLYPAPDQQNVQSPQPEPPIVTTVTGGALPARLYHLVTTFTDSLNGESTTAAYSTPLFIPANKLAVVKSPTTLVPTNDAGVVYSGYKVYASSVSGIPQNLVQQTASPIALGTDWTEPTTGLLTTGPVPPSFNSVATFNGYVIQFRYYQLETSVTSFAQVLQVPDRYFDVVVAGVNWLSLKFLSRMQEATEWFGTYRMGITSMIRDRNQQNRFADYISPDPSSLGGMLPTIETIDLSLLTP